MLFLKELIGLISPQKVKNIKILGSPQSKVRRLYQGICNNTFSDKETVIQDLFLNAPHSKQAFADIKRATRKSLIDALFVINLEKGATTYQKNYINCHKQFAAAKILVVLGLRKGAIGLAEKTLKKTLFNEFTDLTLSLLRILQHYHSINTKNKKKYYIFSELINTQQIQLNKEILLQNCYTELIIKINDVKNKYQLRQLFKHYLKIAKKNIDFENTLITLRNAYFIIVLYYEYVSNYEKIIHYSEEAIEVFLNKKCPVPIAPFLFFYSKSIPYTFQNQQWKKAKELIDKCLGLLHNKTYNYHMILVYQAMLGFHSGQYQLAYEALQLHKKAKLNSPQLTEQWRMIEAWVILFIGWGKIEIIGKKPNFRVFSFINKTPIFGKDKSGNNAAIQMLKFLFLLQKEKYNELIDMSTPFKLYAHRYLKSVISDRTRLIVRTLCAIADEGFDKKLGMLKAMPYYEKLKNHPINFLEHKTVEIVPFELIGQEVFDRL